MTGRNTVEDVVKALDLGADDFLTKPFHAEVLKARMRAVLRRPARLERRLRCVGRLTLDQQSGDILFNKTSIELSPAERRLLALLMRRAGSVVPRALIDDQVYGSNHCNTPNAAEQLVSRLRRSLARRQTGVDVRTVRGLGYVLEEHTQ